MKFFKTLVLSLLIISSGQIAFALDPIAPKSERAFGFLSVDSPLLSDVIQVTPVGTNAGVGVINLKNDDLAKVPVGTYIVRVKMQDKVWTQTVTIQPTELSAIAVTGYGNLRVAVPDPANTMVEVYALDGKQVSRFSASQVKTLPVGNYRVTVKLPAESGARVADPTQDVSIITNETRRVVVWK